MGWKDFDPDYSPPQQGGGTQSTGGPFNTSGLGKGVGGAATGGSSGGPKLFGIGSKGDASAAWAQVAAQGTGTGGPKLFGIGSSGIADAQAAAAETAAVGDPACSIQDLVSGGSLLPYIYCKKVTVENFSSDDTSIDSHNTKVTLNLEIAQSKKEMNKNNALSMISTVPGVSLADYMNIQIVPFQGAGSNAEGKLMKLEPDFEPDKIQEPGNVFVASGHPNYKSLLGTNNSFFPISGQGLQAGEGFTMSENLAYYTGLLGSVSPGTNGFKSISLGEIFHNQNITSQVAWESNLGPGASSEIPETLVVREEVLDGEPYYIISFEYIYTLEYKTNFGYNTSLGFLFYSWLNVPLFMYQNTDFPGSEIMSMNQNFLIGPVNTEIVFFDGQISTTRKQFFLPNGDLWHGAVHAHICDMNPAPDGYCGDGRAMGGPGGPNPSESSHRGWMAGEKHVAGAPKLRLMQAPNNKIQDYRSGTTANLPVYGTTDRGEASFNQQINIFGQTEEVLSSIENILSPFQKETKKYLTKIDNAPGLLNNIVSLYDSDSEYSKLYVTRDKDNSANGIFLIDFERLLRNNSSLYPLLSGPPTNFKIGKCLEQSRLLELKVYRDRVQKRTQGKTYEKYANDTSYEEPSYLVGTIKDTGQYGSPSGITDIREITLKMTKFPNNTGKVRCFMFTDQDVGEKTAGLYQYRIEMSFIDGTYFYLNTLLKEFTKARTEMQKYYDFSLGSYVKPGTLHPAHADDNTYLPGEHPDDTKKPARIKPYFRNNMFDNTNNKFLNDASTALPSAPWCTSGRSDGSTAADPLSALVCAELAGPGNRNILALIYEIYDIFDGGPNVTPEPDVTLGSLIDPVSGSPQGIDFVIRLADSMIDHLQKLIGATKVNKTGSEIASTSIPSGYNFNNFFDYVISSSEATIKEHHTFDHPAELHKALSNEDIYIDYLSVGAFPTNSDNPSGWRGPMIMSKDTYMRRCRADFFRLMPDVATKLPPNPEFTGNDDLFYIHDPDAPDAKDEQQIRAHHAAYSSLMPSIIELSDPSEEDISFGFKMPMFKTLGTLDPELRPWTFESYDKIVLALITYGLNKNDTGDADLLSTYYRATLADNMLKEAYKSLYNSFGISIYDEDKHEELFGQDSGELSNLVLCDPEWPAERYQDCLDDQLSEYPDEFPDTDLPTEDYYKQFLSDVDNIFDVPVGRVNNPLAHHSWSSPNIFKVLMIQESEYGNLSNIFNEVISETRANNNVVKPKHNSFFFLNVNLVSKIQVFTGGDNISGSPMKYDDYSWERLTKETLDTLNNEDYFLCRIKLYTEEAAGGLTLPIINKYFLIKGKA